MHTARYLLDHIAARRTALPSLLLGQGQELVGSLILGALTEVALLLADGASRAPALRASTDIVLDFVGRNESSAAITVHSIRRLELNLLALVVMPDARQDRSLNAGAWHNLPAAAWRELRFSVHRNRDHLFEAVAAVDMRTRTLCLLMNGNILGANDAALRGLISRLSLDPLE